MPGAKKNFIGLEGFIWWIGVVEDRQDPEQLGRVRVRCFGWHSEDKTRIPTDALPWAHPMMPVNNPAAYTPKEGDMVMGFFMDGENAQNPVIMGVLPGKPVKKPDYAKGFSDPRFTINRAGGLPSKPGIAPEAYPLKNYIKEPTLTRLSRNKPDDTVIATRKKNKKSGIKSAGGVSWSEPNPAFAPKYPYNNALETESGHAFELDDTPNQERVHLAHRKGSFFEIDKDGNKVEKVVKDNYTLIMGDDFIYVSGKAAITVDGNFNLKTSTINIEAAAINMAASGDIKIKGASVNIEATSGMNLKAAGVLNATGGGAVGIKGSSVAITGSTVGVNGTFNAGDTNLTVSGSTELASGSGPHKHGIIRQPVTGSGAPSAATADGAGITGGGTTPAGETVPATPTSTAVAAAVGDPARAIADAGAAAVAATGKTLGNLTANIDAAVSVADKVLDKTLLNLSSQIPLGEIQSKLTDAEAYLNGAKGELLSITDKAIKTDVYGKIDQVMAKASSMSLDFNLDKDIVAAVNQTANMGVGEITTVIGKHIYPMTESIPLANT